MTFIGQIYAVFAGAEEAVAVPLLGGDRPAVSGRHLAGVEGHFEEQATVVVRNVHRVRQPDVGVPVDDCRGGQDGAGHRQ